MPGWLVKEIVGGVLFTVPIMGIGKLLGLEMTSWRILVFTYAVLALSPLVDFIVDMIWERG